MFDVKEEPAIAARAQTTAFLWQSKKSHRHQSKASKRSSGFPFSSLVFLYYIILCRSDCEKMNFPFRLLAQRTEVPAAKGKSRHCSSNSFSDTFIIFGVFPVAPSWDSSLFVASLGFFNGILQRFKSYFLSDALMQFILTSRGILGATSPDILCNKYDAHMLNYYANWQLVDCL